MFNKNQFKIQFSEWAADNPFATAVQAREFCTENIPAEQMETFAWLVNQSVQWFEWSKAQKAADQLYSMELEADVL
jgi:hypothetical protein